MLKPHYGSTGAALAMVVSDLVWHFPPLSSTSAGKARTKGIRRSSQAPFSNAETT